MIDFIEHVAVGTVVAWLIWAAPPAAAPPLGCRCPRSRSPSSFA